MTDAGYETLLYDIDGHVATITLNRPEVLNALNDPMRRELVAALRRSEADDDVWVVIITGAGRGFCSGADLRERPMERAQPAPQVSPERDAYPPVLREVTKPIIAAINGATRGAGCNIAFGCDFRGGERVGDVRGQLRRAGPDGGVGGVLPRAAGGAASGDGGRAAGRGLQRPRRGSAGASLTPSCRPRRCCRPRATWPIGSARAPRWPCASPRRRSTAGTS